ncbi:MAG: LVIVD repeat-containing protein, partial [Candidatus Heimdallarchaeota archaeon]
MGKVEFSHTKIVCLIIIGLIAVGSGQAIGFGTSSLLGTSQTTNVSEDTPNISQLDVSDNVVNYSRINTWGGGSYEEQIDMCIVGDFAYVARQDLLIYDISNVSTPYLLGRFECQWGSIVKVFVQDNIACLVCNAIGIVMVNVTDPLNPIELGKCGYFDGQDREYDNYKAEFISSGYRTGDLVFLVAEGGRYGIVNYKTTHYLYAFDVSDPLYPVPVGSYTKNSVEDSITVIGDYCYLFLQGTEVQLPLSIFLLKEPAKLRHIDEVENLVEHNTEFVVSGDLALARKNDSALAILDVANPVVPVNLSYIPGDVFSIYALSESTAYILNRKTKVLEIYDLADPSNPIIKGQTILDGVLKKIINRDNYLYIIGSHLQIVDVANLSAPTLLSKIAGTDGPDYCLAVANKGSSTYILDNKNGISIVNFANYTHPELISQYYSKNLEEKGLWYESDMHVSGNYIYLYSRNFLEIIDVIDEENPFLEAEMTFTENVQEVFVKNKILFVLDDVELKLYDISNSTIPTYLSSIESDSGTQIFADKQIVYHTKYHDSNERTNLTIYNLTDTTAPTILSSHIIEHPVFDMTVRNDYLYILSDEFIIIDAKNATDLITIGSLVLEESM